jgi:hypothetical protein
VTRRARVVVVAATLAVLVLTVCGCSGRQEDAELVGLWQIHPESHGGVARLTLAADHTFHAVGWGIQFECERAVFVETGSETAMWASGTWTFDPAALRLSLEYDAPADRRCKAPRLPPVVVDASLGETDLLVYPGGYEHEDWRVRLRRLTPQPPGRSPTTATNQVACFQEGRRWEQACGLRAYRCVTHHPDAGKACTDGSQCEGRCLAEIATRCTADGCIEATIPEIDQPFVGRCEEDDTRCGSFIEIRKGRAEPVYHID